MQKRPGERSLPAAPSHACVTLSNPSCFTFAKHCFGTVCAEWPTPAPFVTTLRLSVPPGISGTRGESSLRARMAQGEQDLIAVPGRGWTCQGHGQGHLEPRVLASWCSGRIPAMVLPPPALGEGALGKSGPAPFALATPLTLGKSRCGCSLSRTARSSHSGRTGEGHRAAAVAS